MHKIIDDNTFLTKYWQLHPMFGAEMFALFELQAALCSVRNAMLR